MRIRNMIFMLLVLLSGISRVAAAPVTSPEAGVTYYIYNVSERKYLGVGDGSVAVLGSGGVAVTLEKADDTAGSYFVVLPDGSHLSASLYGAVMADGSGKYDQWRFDNVAGGAGDTYTISCRMKEANGFMYLTWSGITDRLTLIQWKPGNIFERGIWRLVAEEDYEENLVVLDETSADYSVPGLEAPYKVHLKRTLTLNSWNTFCVPFAISSTQLKQAFGDGVHVAEFTGSDETTLKFTSVQSVSAGIPYLIYPEKGQLEGGYYEFTGVDGFTAEPVHVSQGAVTYRGYFYKTTAPKGAYVISRNEVYHLQSDMAMKGFRAYFDEDASGDAKLSRWSLDEGATTSIDGVTEDIAGDADGDGAVYSISGQRVRTKAQGTNGLAKGVYIRNGKKVTF